VPGAKSERLCGLKIMNSELFGAGNSTVGGMIRKDVGLVTQRAPDGSGIEAPEGRFRDVDRLRKSSKPLYFDLRFCNNKYCLSLPCHFILSGRVDRKTGVSRAREIAFFLGQNAKVSIRFAIMRNNVKIMLAIFRFRKRIWKSPKRAMLMKCI
jgi:hypothetical protein